MGDLTFTSVAKSFDYGHSQMIGVKLSGDNDVTGIIYSVDDSRETLSELLIEMAKNVKDGIGKIIISKKSEIFNQGVIRQSNSASISDWLTENYE